MSTNDSPRWCILMIEAFLLCVSIPCLAQTDQNSFLTATPQGTTTNYHFAEPSELTIVVSLLGPVQRPGRYEISRTIDLPNLISLAGGTREGADLSDIRIMRTMKEGSQIKRKEIRVDLQKELSATEGYLQLTQGDFIVVGETSWMSFRDVLTIITTAAAVTTSIVYLVYVAKR
jgi:hypothetical protein